MSTWFALNLLAAFLLLVLISHDVRNLRRRVTHLEKQLEAKPTPADSPVNE